MGLNPQRYRALPGMVRCASQKVTDMLKDEDRAWVVRQGPFVALYVFYGLGSYFVEDTNRRWYSVVPWYVVVAALAWLCLAWWVPKFTRAFQGYQRSERWQDELQGTGLVSFGGVTGVYFVTLGTQIFLMTVAYRPDDSLLWVISFALISPALAGIGSYFLIGYPGMVNLELLDERLHREGASGKSVRDLPRGLMASLEAELAMLRTILAGLVYVYVFVAVGILLAFDRIALLLGSDTFAGVPLPSKIWFICGVALLLVGCHASITGPVHGQYFRITRWLRDVDTAG